VKRLAKRNVREIIAKNISELFSEAVGSDGVMVGCRLSILVDFIVGVWLGLWDTCIVGVAVGESGVGVNDGRIKNLSPT